MIDLNKIDSILLYPGYADMRLGINGLIKLTSREKQNLNKRTLYIYCSKNKNSIKIIEKEENSYWLYQNKLTKGKFLWPEKGKETQITKEQLLWIIKGITLIKKIENNGEDTTKNITYY